MKELERLVEQRAGWKGRERTQARNSFRLARILAACGRQEKVLPVLPPAIPKPRLATFHQGDIEIGKWEAPMVVVSCTVLQEDIGILIAFGIEIAQTIEQHT